MKKRRRRISLREALDIWVLTQVFGGALALFLMVLALASMARHG